MKENIRKVCKVLLEWGECWQGYKGLSEDTGIQIKELKNIMKQLKELGIVVYGTSVNDDGMISGSGYWLNIDTMKDIETRMKG